ncbi:MAG: chloride channel protein [Pyrinomonadaceae bacterium]|nr:chloride channel protein [Pyrinomonadaceae bacterium]
MRIRSVLDDAARYISAKAQSDKAKGVQGGVFVRPPLNAVGPNRVRPLSSVRPAGLLKTSIEPRAPTALGLAYSVVLQIVIPAVIGAVTGVCITAASWFAMEPARDLLATLPGSWPAVFSPVALLLTLAITTWITRVSRPSTAELYITTYHAPEARLPLRQIPGRFLAALTTVSLGGSQGLESASALLGAALGQLAGRVGRLRVSDDEHRTLLVCGASAGIAAVFSSPAVGALYGIEIPYRRDIDARRLVPCAIAAVSAYAVRAVLTGPRHLVVMDATPKVDLTFVAGVVLVAVACGLGGHLFAWMGEWLKNHTTRNRRLARAAGAGVLLALLAWAGHTASGSWITFGPGYIAADWLFTGSHSFWLLSVVLLIRIAGTLVCVYGGGGGGVFTSLACSGAFVGQIVAEALGRTDSHVFPFLGAACFLGSGYRIPLACMMLVCEQSTSMSVVVAGLAAVAISQVLMGRDSVSDAQHRDRMD